MERFCSLPRALLGTAGPARPGMAQHGLAQHGLAAGSCCCWIREDTELTVPSGAAPGHRRVAIIPDLSPIPAAPRGSGRTGGVVAPRVAAGIARQVLGTAVPPPATAPAGDSRSRATSLRARLAAGLNNSN